MGQVAGDDQKTEEGVQGEPAVGSGLVRPGKWDKDYREPGRVLSQRE